MRALVILFFILGISQFVIFAQDSTEKSGCPVFSVIGPSVINNFDEPINFRLKIDRKLGLNIKFDWMVYGGKLISGQGTESITVKNISGQTATATIALVGLPDNCQNTFSASAPTFDPEPIMPMKADEFGKIPDKILKENISIFFRNA